MQEMVDVGKIASEILNKKVSNLWRRDELGKPLRSRLEQKLAELEEGAVLVLDFRTVEDISGSVADEIGPIFMNRVINGDFGEKFVVYYGGNADVSHALQTEFSRKKGKVVGLALNGKNGIYGELPKYLLDSFFAVQRKNDGITYAEIAKKLTIEEGNASKRLTQLFSLRLVRREEYIPPNGGKQYVYKSIVVRGDRG